MWLRSGGALAMARRRSRPMRPPPQVVALVGRHRQRLRAESRGPAVSVAQVACMSENVTGRSLGPYRSEAAKCQELLQVPVGMRLALGAVAKRLRVRGRAGRGPEEVGKSGRGHGADAPDAAPAV